jgi:transposase-like protein
LSAETQKVEPSGNSIRPDEPAPRKENDSPSSMAERVEPVKLGRLDEVERATIAKVIAETGGNMTAAARVLGIDRRTLYRKIDALQIVVEDREPQTSSPLRAAIRELITEELGTALRKDPWLTLGLVKDDLRQIAALLERDSVSIMCVESLKHAQRALSRFGEVTP